MNDKTSVLLAIVLAAAEAVDHDDNDDEDDCEDESYHDGDEE